MSGRTTRTERALCACALTLAAIVVSLFRPTGHVWRTVFAEDGAIYFQQAHDHGVAAVLFRGYAGYLQLPPRILGAVATLAPTRELALWLAVEGAVVCGLLASFAYWATTDLIESVPVRVALASLVVLMPAMGYENAATITNTIWSFLAVAPLAILATGTRPGAVSLRAAMALLAATSSVLAVLYAPLAIGVFVWRRSRDAAIVAGALGAGLAIQIIVVLHTHNDTSTTHRSIARLVDLVGVRVFAEYVLGEKGIGTFWAVGVLAAATAALAVIVALAVLLGSAERLQGVVTVCAGYAVAMFVVPVWGRGTSAVLLTNREAVVTLLGGALGVARGGRYISSGMRYSVVPVFLVGVALAVGAGAARGKVGRAARGVFIAHVVVLAFVGFSVTGSRSGRLDWSREVTVTYRTRCSGRRSHARVVVPTEAGRFTEYSVALRCDELGP